MTREQRRIVAELYEDCDRAETTGDGSLCDRRWVFRLNMRASLSGHVGCSEPAVSLYESRKRPGVWFAMQSIPNVPWAAGPGDLEDVVDDVTDYLLDETVRADGPRLALARADHATRRAS